ITALKVAEDDLRKSERNYREIFNAVSDAIFIHDADTGEILDINKAVTRLFGISPEETLDFLFDRGSRGVSPYSKREAIRWLRKAVTEGPQVFEWNARKNNGELFWVEVSLRSAEIGGERRILAIVRDITLRKSAEEALRESEKKFRALFENAGDAILLMHHDLFVDCNSRSVQLYGCENREGIIGHHPYEFSPRFQTDGRESRVGALEKIAAALDGRQQLFEWTHIRHDGTPFPAEVKLNRIDIDNKTYLQAIVRDITERKQAEQALRTSEERLRKIFENAATGIAITDWEGRYQECNPAFCALVGYTEKELRRIIFSSIVHPEDRAANLEAMHRLRIGEIPSFEIENRYVHKDGHAVWIRKFVSVFTDETKTPGHFVALVTDITERKRTEEALRASEEHLRTTLNSIADAVITTDTAGKVAGINPVAEKITGWRVFDALGKPLVEVLNLVDERTGKRGYDPVESVLKTGKPVELADHTALISRDGTEHLIADSNAPIKNEAGETTGAVLVFRDVTEEFRMQEALRKSEDRLAKTLRAANDGMWDWNLENDEVYFDPRYYRMAGYEVNEFPHTLEEFKKRIHPDDLDFVIEHSNRHLRGEIDRFEVEFRFRKKDGGWLWVLGRGVIVERDETGRPRRFVGTHTDITLRKEAEERLQVSLREKTTLLQELYHRTKNNMQVISSFLELQAALSESQEVGRIIQDSQSRIYTMALAHEKLYKGKSLSRVNMKEYIMDLTQLLVTGFGVSSEQISLYFDIQEIDCLIDIAMPCGLIINELLSNTFKHAFPQGRKGRVTITFRRLEGNERELTVGDNGIGVSQDFSIERIPSLGIQLVVHIVQHQLHGSVFAHGNGGLFWRIRFREDLYRERV
ncbi:MAG: PAS domain S-box protein, partial [Chitinivibrionales bacterium]|nr:PAS domain S-box protein [Chitinivibrionales bacterium]MBD3358342.1 PAS domain S-box protein [Chitinivibrionales bacterium]